MKVPILVFCFIMTRFFFVLLFFLALYPLSATQWVVQSTLWSAFFLFVLLKFPFLSRVSFGRTFFIPREAFLLGQGITFPQEYREVAGYIDQSLRDTRECPISFGIRDTCLFKGVSFGIRVFSRECRIPSSGYVFFQEEIRG